MPFVRILMSFLRSEQAYNDFGLGRDRQLVRLTALLHDVGHAPFSHASEDLLPSSEHGDSYRHEAYSARIVERHFRQVIEGHRANNNWGFRAEDVSALLEGRPEAR